MDKFEKLIKDSVQDYEAPYNADAWKSLNKKLGPSKGTISKWIIGSAAVVAIIATSYHYFGNDSKINTKNTLISEDNSSNEYNSTSETVQNTVESTDNTNTTSNSKNNTQSELNGNQSNIETELLSDITDNTNQENDFDITSQPNANIAENNLTAINVNDNNTSNAVTNNTPEFKAGIIVNQNTQCLSESFKFTPTVPKQKVIYEWTLGDGTIKTGGVINHKYVSAGTYTVQLTLRDQKSNKVIKQSESIDITVLNVPQTSFVVETSNDIIPQTNFRNETKQVVSTQWEIVGLYSSARSEFNYAFKHKGDYVVNLTTSFENGCSSMATKVISVEKDYNLLAPTAFSPNGDFLNDEFIPKALPLLNLPFTMTIYDRQGKMVYQTTDANQPWDGLYTQDAVPAPNGVYIWVVQLTNENGEIEQYQDQVTIAR